MFLNLNNDDSWLRIIRHLRYIDFLLAIYINSCNGSETGSKLLSYGKHLDRCAPYTHYGIVVKCVGSTYKYNGDYKGKLGHASQPHVFRI